MYTASQRVPEPACGIAAPALPGELLLLGLREAHWDNQKESMLPLGTGSVFD